MPTKAVKEPAGINVPLLLKIIDHIKEEPKRFAMSVWLQKRGEFNPKVFDSGAHSHPFAECNTAACIGGWAVVLSKKRIPPNDDDILYKAQDVLRLTESQAYRLFLLPNWPDEYRQAYLDAKTPFQRTRIAIRRIKHFIKTHGED